MEKTTATCSKNTGKHITITWKKCAERVYFVYRSSKQDGKYHKLATVKGAEKYCDKKVKKGAVYYYKVLVGNPKNESKALQESKFLKVKVKYLKAPKITIKKKKRKKQKILEIKLKSYEGTYAQIQGKVNDKFVTIKIKKRTIRAYKGIYRLTYRQKKKKMYFRVRTWKKIKGKKCYSDFSNLVYIIG